MMVLAKGPGTLRFSYEPYSFRLGMFLMLRWRRDDELRGGLSMPEGTGWSSGNEQAGSVGVRWVLLWAVGIVLLASVPYLFGSHFTPPGYRFLGLTQNIDDGAVYLSWTRQAADGHFFMRNLFTKSLSPGVQVNMLFLLMGWVAWLTADFLHRRLSRVPRAAWHRAAACDLSVCLAGADRSGARGGC